ncbi:MAG: flagellin [Planctomycetes bacterium]|nr:flagellin [Planctomycetota bacterium]
MNDIRGLVSEAANEGAMSVEQIAANQLQLDSSLESIDRIAKVTQFQGRRLLDGTLDFISKDVDRTRIIDLQIDQANFGALTEIGVNVDVVAQATKARLTYAYSTLPEDVVLEVAGKEGSEAFSFSAGSSATEMRDAINLVSDALGVEASLADRVADTATAGQAKVLNSDGTSGFTVEAASTGEAVGNFTVNYSLAAGDQVADNTATWNAGTPNVINVAVAADQWTTYASDATDVSGGTFQLAMVGANDTLQVTALVAGDVFDGLTVTVNSVGTADSTSYDYETNTITLDFAAAVPTTADIETAINTDLAGLFLAVTPGEDDDTVQAGTLTLTHVGTGNAGLDGGVVSANGTIANIATEIAALNEIAAITPTGGTNLIEITTASGTIGSVNSTADGSAIDDPNNMIQLSGTDKAKNLDVTFAAAGANQSFFIDFQLNERTNGYSTAYLTSTQDDKAAAVKVVYAAEQGQQWDGIDVTYVSDATDRSVIWDKENKALTVYNAATASANDIRDQINNALGSTFTASVIGTGGATATAFTTGDTAATADGKIYDSITVNLATDANSVVTTTAAEAVNKINASAAFTGLEISASHVFSSDGSGTMETGTLSLGQLGVTGADAAASGTTSAINGEKAQITVTAKTAGSAYDDVKVVFVEDAGVTQNSGEYATYDASNKVLTFTVNPASTAAEVVNNWSTSSLSTAAAALFSTAVVNGGSGIVDALDVGYLSGGVTYSGTTTGGVAAEGNFDAGDVVGTGGLDLQSTEYGSDMFVSVKALSGTFVTADENDATTERNYGTDINARINGIQAIGKGLQATINTSVLDLSFSVLETVADGTTTSFTITGGGAQFQLGPDVVSNQQARLGIQSVNTAKLGGVAGRLYELRSGGTKSLENDTNAAARVVEEVITQVTTLRGRLGAFQRTTLETNIRALADTLEALTAAESSIRDADFAAESANLTRAQILVQSGLSVLSIANQNPRNVLALLQQ